MRGRARPGISRVISDPGDRADGRFHLLPLRLENSRCAARGLRHDFAYLTRLRSIRVTVPHIAVARTDVGYSNLVIY